MAKSNRSANCSCGSGKKYKKCCLIKNYPRFQKSSVSTDNKLGNKVKLWDRSNWQ